MKIVPDENFIINNFDKTIKLVREHVDGTSLIDMLEFFGERYATCPASSKKEYYSWFPGGLAYHNLFTFFWAKKFASIMSPDKYNTSTLLKVSILHEIGKVGNKEEDYYIPQTSDWHRDQGMYYSINDKIPYMKINQRSLCLAQEFGVALSEKEYIAILALENNFFKFKESSLSLVLEFAANWAKKLEKQNVIILP